MVLSADCPLLLLYDPLGHAIGVIHASWRSSVLRIVQKAVDTLNRAFGSQPVNLLACLSPSIGPCCYDVGDDLVDYAWQHDFDLKTFLTTVGKRRYLDLWSLNREQLIQSGLSEENIEIAEVCNRCRDDFFYSYRRDGPKTGRYGALMMLL